MRDERLRELALRGLLAERERIDSEISELETRSRPRRSTGEPRQRKTSKARRKRRMTPTQRKAASQWMKAYWAKRKRSTA